MPGLAACHALNGVLLNALPVSRPRVAFGSRVPIITVWPLAARVAAMVWPTTPVPKIPIFMIAVVRAV